MRHIREFRTSLPVADPIGFVANPHQPMSALVENYQGRCFQGSFIVKIEKILKKSACRISTSDNTGSGSVDVEFSAQVETVQPDEVYVDAVVNDNAKGQDPVTLSYNVPGRVQMVIGIVGKLNVRPKQIVPVRIIQARHEPLKGATAAAKLFTCSYDKVAYRVTQQLGAAEKQRLRPLYDEVIAELEAREQLMKSRKEKIYFFEAILYGHRGADVHGDTVVKSTPEWRGPRSDRFDSAAPVLVGLDGAVGVWFRPAAVFRSSPTAVRVASEDLLPKGWPVVDATPEVAIGTILRDIHIHLVALRELVATYSNEEVRAGHANVWKAMVDAQAP